MTARPRLDLARLIRTMLSLPLRPRLGSAVDASGSLSLTGREEVAYRATTRRLLRAMTRVAGITVVGLASLNAVGMCVIFPERRAAVLAIMGIEALFALGVTALVLGPARRRPLPLAFVIAFSLVVTVLHLLAFVPESATTSFMLLALIPAAVALFFPWSRRVQVAWLLAGAAALAAFTMAPSGAAFSTSDWAKAWLVLTISGLASAVGIAGAETARRDGFTRQVELRRSHMEGRAREALLERLATELAGTARIDPLTGLGNRLRLNDDLASMTAHLARYEGVCAVVLLDLDQFKGYNDSLGHLAGDAALQAVATALQVTTRASDTVCRFGGEEFVVLMPEQDIDGAARAAERIRAAVERLDLRYQTAAGPQVAKGMGRNRVATTPLCTDRPMRGGPSGPPLRESPGLASTLDARPAAR